MTNEELERAVELLEGRCKPIDAHYARYPNSLDRTMEDTATAIRAILSERAELLAAVERMRGTLEEADRRLSRPDWTVQRDVTRMAIRAALTTGEATSTEQGERG